MILIVESQETDNDDAPENDNNNSAMEIPYSPLIPLTLSFPPINEDAFATTESTSHSNNPAGEKKGMKVSLGTEGTIEGTKEAAVLRKLHKFTSKAPMCNSIFLSKKGLKRNKDVVTSRKFSMVASKIPIFSLKYTPRNDKENGDIDLDDNTRTYEDTCKPPGLVSTSYEANCDDDQNGVNNGD